MTGYPIRAVEGETTRVPADAYEDLAREGERVALELGLRFGGVTRLPGALRFDNMIGTIAKGRVAVEIVPKTNPGQDWMRSVLDLMDDRPVVIADEQPASDSAPTPRFIDLIGRTYAGRLANALSLEGPITTIETTFSRSPMLSGRLRVGEWLQRAAYDGHRFPVDRQVLTTANAYARTLAYVGQLLAPYVQSGAVRQQLRELSNTLGEGCEIPDAPSNAVGLQLPSQWGAYEPAWSIAQMILRQRTRFGQMPQPHGMSLVIEPWILLERLLERTLTQLARQLSSGGASFGSRSQSGCRFLIGEGRDDRDRYLVPDCVLLHDGSPVVNFEAKYRNYVSTGGPLRGESYQAITAGRALGTTLAVLVYPNATPTRILVVQKPGHFPARLALVGLDLFSYRRGPGERDRAQHLRTLLENASGTDILHPEGEAA